MAEKEAKVKSKADEPIAIELAKRQRDISVAEFFEKNRHLLGFDSKRKALLMAVKEAVDNSLDACEEAGVLPEVSVELIDMGSDRFRVIVEDNGPGIVKKQVPNIFAKLLYGSKFHRLKQARGQQGIGISAAALYGQLTTGKPIRIKSKIGATYPAYYCELLINTQQNQPEIVKEQEMEWNKEHGTRIELDLEATYQKGSQSVDEYLKEVAIVNPHVTIVYVNPKAEQQIFARATQQMPIAPKEIQPHPHGLELGFLLKMLKWTESRTLQSFLTTELSRVGPGTAKEICERAALLSSMKPRDIGVPHAEKLISAMRETKIIAPPTDCVSPIGAELIEKGLRKEIKAEFYYAVSRSPDVYRGNPFVIEAGIAYGGELQADQPVVLLRFANRVPLLYQQGACAITEAVTKTSWKAYGLQQSGSNMPSGPAVITVHLASVWAPFTSEAKEAIAHYSEIMKEIKLALQECGRHLGFYVNKKRRVQDEFKKRSYIEKYLPHIGIALKNILHLKDSDVQSMVKILEEVLESSRQSSELENEEYNEDVGESLGLELRDNKDAEENDEYDEDGKSAGKSKVNASKLDASQLNEKNKDEKDKYEKDKSNNKSDNKKEKSISKQNKLVG